MKRPGPYDHTAEATLTRTDLIERVRALGFTREQADGHVDEALKLAISGLIETGTLRLPNFGRFDVVERKATTARDLRTGASIPVPSRHTVSFKPAPSLRQSLTQALTPSETS